MILSDDIKISLENGKPRIRDLSLIDIEIGQGTPTKKIEEVKE